MTDQIMVSSVSEIGDKLIKCIRISSEFSCLYHLINFGQLGSIIVTLVLMVHLTPCFVNAINIKAEYKHVFFPDFLSNLNIGSIHGSNDKATIHNEFHVRGT